jgi:hypothetical protein
MTVALVASCDVAPLQAMSVNKANVTGLIRKNFFTARPR